VTPDFLDFHRGFAMMNSMSEEFSSDALFDKLKWMNAREAAFYLRVSVGQIRNMVWRGQLKSYKARNRLRFLRTDLDRLMKPSF
jgi:excisionase family DNA binding protein